MFAWTLPTEQKLLHTAGAWGSSLYVYMCHCVEVSEFGVRSQIRRSLTAGAHLSRGGSQFLLSFLSRYEEEVPTPATLATHGISWRYLSTTLAYPRWPKCPTGNWFVYSRRLPRADVGRWTNVFVQGRTESRIPFDGPVTRPSKQTFIRPQLVFSYRATAFPQLASMASGLTLACSIRPLLVASLGIALVVLLYAITLSVIIAAALSRLSVVHNGAAEFTEQVYFALPFVFSRRRGSVPGAAVPRRQADFHFAFPQMCHSASSPSIQCAICMDAIRPGHLKRRLACQHEYHKVCCF